MEKEKEKRREKKLMETLPAPRTVMKGSARKMITTAPIIAFIGAQRIPHKATTMWQLSSHANTCVTHVKHFFFYFI